MVAFCKVKTLELQHLRDELEPNVLTVTHVEACKRTNVAKATPRDGATASHFQTVQIVAAVEVDVC